MKPICVTCKRFMAYERAGIYFEEGMPLNTQQPAMIDESGWGPYKLWVGDLYKCRQCKAEVVVGVPKLPLAEHYQETYPESVKRWPPAFRVNDCP